jgi:chromatin remodeling complex protein RSC6
VTTTKKEQSQPSGSSFLKPVQPDAALGAIVGTEPLPRTEVTKRIWDYIRQHGLQDPKDKRTIRADAKLRQVFAGKDSVSMFELTKLVNAHMLEGDSTTGYRKKKGR